MIERQQEFGPVIKIELEPSELLSGMQIMLHVLHEHNGEWYDTGSPIAGVVTQYTEKSADTEEGFLFMPEEPMGGVDGSYDTICPRFIPRGVIKKELDNGTVAKLRFAAYPQR